MTPYGLLRLRALAPDRAGGLRHVNSAVMSILANVLPLFTFIGALGYVHGLTVPVSLATIGLVVLVLLIYLVPISAVHTAMVKRRTLLLGEIERKFNVLNGNLRQALRADGNGSAVLSAELLDVTKKLHDAHKRLLEVPVWPFDAASLSRLLLAVAYPLFLTVLGTTLHKLAS